MAAGPCTFEHTKVYFAPALLNAGLTGLGSLPRAQAHLAAATRLSGLGTAEVIRTADLAGLASTAASDLHRWLSTRWLTLISELWQAWGKAQPPKPSQPDPLRPPPPPCATSRAYTLAGRIARPPRAPCSVTQTPAAPRASRHAIPHRLQASTWIGPRRNLPGDEPDGSFRIPA